MNYIHFYHTSPRISSSLADIVRNHFLHIAGYLLHDDICKEGYDVKATLYTGGSSGYNLESDKRTDWATVQNSMDNLISIMHTESTLKRVCLRLFARILIQVTWIKGKITVLPLPAITIPTIHLKNSPNGAEILKLIDKSSEDKTVS